MSEQEVEGEPAHHARRPMNAFLIFCKRHRSVVRDKYPNLENRSITKILGEWWANLDKEEKACYTGLAKQYKDAFFNANPDFKWYKLPAPPLRTLSARPRDLTDKPEPSGPDYQEVEYEKTNNNSTKVDLNSQSHDDEEPQLSMFTPGKLADEAHMGGLSSLLEIKTEKQTANPFYSPPNFRPQDDSRKIGKREDNISELQNALSETSKMFQDDFDKGKVVRYAPTPNEFTNQDVINQIVDKRYYSEEDKYQRNWIEDEKNGRCGRSCKGKRYQEFMAVGGLIVNKRQKRDSDKYDENYPASCSHHHDYQEEPSVTDDSQVDNEIEIPTDADKEIDAAESEHNSNKTFKAADFDLDAKIRALPSLSLEKFQQKKRDNKRKKKTLNLKPKVLEAPIINSVARPYYDPRREIADKWREHVIGSQKRKPRKMSITRLEINSMVSSVDLREARKISPEIKLAMEAPCTAALGGGRGLQAAHGGGRGLQAAHGGGRGLQAAHAQDGGLLALETLAEVASNTSKIESTSIVFNGDILASEGNPSKV